MTTSRLCNADRIAVAPTHSQTRRFSGKVFNLAAWVPTKAGAQNLKRQWGNKLGANVRVVKMKYGYNIYVRT